jgi:hypothetical protein
MLDQEQGYPLRALLEIVGEQAEVVKEDIAGLWDDFFIETCAEWAVPYIGELVDCRRLPAGARRRAVVAKAIHYRRRKGTLAMLEELARDVTGWGARVQPFADLLGWSQSLEHLRIRTAVGSEGYDPGTVDLRDPNALDRLDGPFDFMGHTADVRPMGFREGHLREGYHNLGRVGFFLWRLRRYPVRGATARRADPPNDHGYHFSPLGNPTPLFTRPAPRADGTDRVRETDVPGPIRTGALARDLQEHRRYEGDAALYGETRSSAYYGPNRSLGIIVGGESVPPDEVVVENLEGWDRPTPPHKVAVDVRLGRLAFAAGAEPAREVRVNYNYGFSANLGGGPYYRRLPAANDPILVSRPASPGGPAYPFSTLSEALSEWQQSTNHPSGIIEIADSQTYEEDLEIDYGEDQETTGRELVLQAAHGQRPTLIGDLTVKGTSAHGRLTLSGLMIAGHIRVRGGLESLDISHCTLVPGRRLNEEGRPHHPELPSVVVEPGGERCRVNVDHSIVGPLRLPQRAELDVADSIVDSPMRTGPATQVRALVSGDLSRFSGLASDEPSLDVTVGDEGTYTAVLDEKPTTLAQARDQLQDAIHSAHDSPAFARARVVVVGSWLVVLSGSDMPMRISASDGDDTASRLRLDSASSRQVCALLGGPLSPFPELSASSPAVRVTVDAEGPHIAELGTRPASLFRTRKLLHDAIRDAPGSPAFEKAVVASVDDRLLVLPGPGGEAIVVGPAPGDETTLSDLALEGPRPAIAADHYRLPGPSTRLQRTTIFGQVHVSLLSLASEVVFTGPVVVERRQTGEVLYSYVPEGSRAPARRYCQPDLELSRQAGRLGLGYCNALSPIEKDEVSVRLKPTFTSSLYGQPGYAQLGIACHKGIKTGAEDGSEMGVFRHLGQPQREASLRDLLDEFLPVGLRRGFINVT